MKEGTRIEKTLSENQNFPVKVDDKIYWISRAMAVVGYVFKEVDGKLFVLTEKRGKGAADYIGHFCVFSVSVYRSGGALVVWLYLPPDRIHRDIPVAGKKDRR